MPTENIYCKLRSEKACFGCNPVCKDRINPGFWKYIYLTLFLGMKEIISQILNPLWLLKKRAKKLKATEPIIDMLIGDMKKNIEVYTKHVRYVEYLNEEMGGVILNYNNTFYVSNKFKPIIKPKLKCIILENMEDNKARHFRYGRMDFIIHMMHWRKEGYKYKGEWHTHPRRMPELTKRDHRAMKWKALIYGKIYLVIAKYQRHKIYYGVYQYNRFGLITKKQALYYKSVTFKQQIQEIKKRNQNENR